MSELIHENESRKIQEVDRIEADHPSLDKIKSHESRLLAAEGIPKAEPVAHDCHTQFHAYHKSGRRPLSAIKWIVMHSTEGGTARGVASYFTESSSGGSTQLVVDDYSCYRCLPDNEIPWGAPGANYAGFHIEQCGYAAWHTTLWSKTHRRTLQRAAYKAAFHCKKYGIPVRFVAASGLKAGKAGITTHAECSKAFLPGGHTDPGAGWPRLLFMSFVRGYYAVMKIRRVA